MKHAYQIGNRVRTKVGSFDNPEYVYANIAAIIANDNGNILYRLNYDEGGYDYMYDFEIEPA